jgi:hypothetical protein
MVRGANIVGILPIEKRTGTEKIIRTGQIRLVHAQRSQGMAEN